MQDVTQRVQVPNSGVLRTFGNRNYRIGVGECICLLGI